MMNTPDIESEIKDVIETCEGWCRLDKALALAQLIREHQISLSVEIGVAGGRSFLPQALAHKHYTGGTAVGIDPWETQAALVQICTGNAKEIAERAQVKFKDFDFEAQFQAVQQRIVRYAVQDHCRIIRKESRQAVDDLPNDIGLLHIDGNHGNDAVMLDARLYVPKVKSGGFIWFDDVKWDSVQPAVEYAKSMCTLHKIFDHNNVILRRN